MSKKIHQELFRIAKEILEKDKTPDLQKVYDQTLSLFEQLILIKHSGELSGDCLLYTSPSPRDRQKSRMPSSA